MMRRANAIGAICCALCVLAVASQDTGLTPQVKQWMHSHSNPTWGRCTFNTSSVPFPVRCANVSVPRDWYHQSDAPLLPTTVFVSIVEAPNSIGTVWFLNGGSGVGGACGPGSQWMNYYASLGFSVALPDFRGAGMSTPKLYCPGDPNGLMDPTIECAKHFNTTFGGRGMYNFSITQGSHDLAYLIATLTPANNSVFIQGDSFGSFWGQRYLAIYPQQLTGAMIESFPAPNRWQYFQAADNIQWASTRLLEYCAEDAECQAHLGGGMDTDAFLAKIVELSRAGVAGCGLGNKLGPNTTTQFQVLLGSIIGSAATYRPVLSYLPAVLYRFARCDDTDAALLLSLIDKVGTKGEGVHHHHGLTDSSTVCDISQVALYNLFFSEGVDRTTVPSANELAHHLSKLLAQVPLSLIEGMRMVYSHWPLYDYDQYHGVYSNTTRPVLFVNGDLDISCPWEQAAFTQLYYPGSNHRLFRLPTCPHVSFLNSPVDNSPVPCGLQLMAEFLQGGYNNVTAMSGDCAAHIVPLDFMGTSPDPVRDEYFPAMYGGLWNFTLPMVLPVDGH